MFNIYGTLAFLVIFCIHSIKANDENHKYSRKEAVTLWVNSVGPYNNPQETYPYYDLPFCKPAHGIETKKKVSGIGEVLEGNELRNSGLKLHFPDDEDRELVCELTLDGETATTFESMVDQQYWYELFLDDLPMWGMVGEVLRDEEHSRMEKHIFTHRSLSLAYNGNRIVEANLTSENPVPIEKGRKLKFTYSVVWHNQPFKFFEHQIHWFSVFNSFMMVVFLCGLVGLILLRTLRSDLARYAKENDDLDLESMQGLGDGDSGWKQIHGDVFRAPVNLVTFSALLGTGWQLLILVLCVILYAMAGRWHGHMYEDRGEMVSTFIVCYALSSVVGGYVSGSFYRQYFSTPKAEAASQWQKTMVCTISLFPFIVCIVTSMLNGVAVYYDTISAIPLMVIVKMLSIWIFVSLPLSVVGTVAGRHWSGKYEPICRVNSIPRPIPTAAWWADAWFVIPAAGILPFGSIFIEMYFMFTALWSYKFYYVYGFVLLVYAILSMVTICTTIVAVYCILNAENYHWQWIAFGSAASTGGYVFAYSVYYFFYKTKMTGLLQISYYYGYMGLFCVALSLMCGSIGTWGATLFVKKIYRNVKID